MRLSGSNLPNQLFLPTDVLRTTACKRGISLLGLALKIMYGIFPIDLSMNNDFGQCFTPDPSPVCR